MPNVRMAKAGKLETTYSPYTGLDLTKGAGYV